LATLSEPSGALIHTPSPGSDTSTPTIGKGYYSSHVAGIGGAAFPTANHLFYLHKD